MEKIVQSTEAVRQQTIRELKSLLDRLPRLGKEADDFEKDIEDIRCHQPNLPLGETWE
ncbi:MAG: hypothetical protein Q7T53_04380 [Deltaproteobacteria bacterium]|nr:hypothetical protein [Deltaproteobacteria bacterium]